MTLSRQKRTRINRQKLSNNITRSVVFLTWRFFIWLQDVRTAVVHDFPSFTHRIVYDLVRHQSNVASLSYRSVVVASFLSLRTDKCSTPFLKGSSLHTPPPPPPPPRPRLVFCVFFARGLFVRSFNFPLPASLYLQDVFGVAARKADVAAQMALPPLIQLLSTPICAYRRNTTICRRVVLRAINRYQVFTWSPFLNTNMIGTE